MAMEDEVHDLRMRIIRLETQMAYLYKHLNIAMADGSQADDDPRIVEFIRQGDIMQAVKRYHEIYHCSLAEAQRSVEDIRRRLGA